MKSQKGTSGKSLPEQEGLVSASGPLLTMSLTAEIFVPEP